MTPKPSYEASPIQDCIMSSKRIKVGRMRETTHCDSHAVNTLLSWIRTICTCRISRVCRSNSWTAILPPQCCTPQLTALIRPESRLASTILQRHRDKYTRTSHSFFLSPSFCQLSWCVAMYLGTWEHSTRGCIALKTRICGDALQRVI